MKINQAGINLIKSLEGCRLKAYKLKGERYYTIGFGHTNSTIKKDDVISQETADKYLTDDLMKFEAAVNLYGVKKFHAMNENQFAALVSYAYNRGVNGLKELINFSDSLKDVGINMVILWGSNKNYKDALIKRRQKEQALFNKAVGLKTEFAYLPGLIKVPEPTLKRGDMGREVEFLQTFLCLNSPKCNIKRDGIFGEQTYKALKTFQEANYLIIDGIYGPQSFAKVRDLIEGV